MCSLQNTMFSSYIIAAFSGSWTWLSFSKDPKAFYKRFQHMANCKIAPEKKKILFAAFSLIFPTSSRGLMDGALSLDAKRGSGLHFCKGLFELLPKTTTRKFSSATLLRVDNSGSNPHLWGLRQNLTLLHQNQRASPPTPTMGWQTHKRSHFSRYKCKSAFPAPPPGTSLMANQRHCPWSSTAQRPTVI